MKPSQLSLALAAQLAGHALGANPSLRMSNGNPAWRNCRQEGGTPELKYGADGGQYAICVFNPNGGRTACDTWKLFNDECEEGDLRIFSRYCDDNGGVVSQPPVSGAPGEFYQECTFPDGGMCLQEDYYQDMGCDGPTPTKRPTKRPTNKPTREPGSGCNGEAAGVATDDKQDCADFCEHRMGSAFGWHWHKNSDEIRCECTDGKVCVTPRAEGEEGGEVSEESEAFTVIASASDVDLEDEGLKDARLPPDIEYCEKHRGTMKYLYEDDGDEYAICVFNPNGGRTACDSWAYYRGECNKGELKIFARYCDDNGGVITQPHVDWGETEGAPTAFYQLCTFDDDSTCREQDYYEEMGCDVPTMNSEDSAADVVIGHEDSKVVRAESSPIPPDARRCERRGGVIKNLYEQDGGQYAICIFDPNGGRTACDSWMLYNRECRKGDLKIFSRYCDDNGGVLTAPSVDWGETEGAPAASYQQCAFDDDSICLEQDYYEDMGCNLQDGTTIMTE